MKFKEFVENCNKLLEETPEAGEYETIYAKDDEGNGYHVIGYAPSLGIKEDDNYYCDWTPADHIKEDPDCDYTEKDLNSVCIN